MTRLKQPAGTRLCAARRAPWRNPGLVMLAVLLSLDGFSARAADPVRGKSLYASTPGGTSCANSACHGTDPTRNANKILRGANSPTTIQNAINNNTGGMGIYRNNVLTATDIADIAAYLGNPNAASGPSAALSPTALSFASTNVGSSSANQTVALSNSGGAALSITAISVSSTNFAIAGGTCAAGGSVAAAGTCTILVSFRPQSAGALTGTLTISHNASGGTSTANLSGTGAAAAATVTATPTALSFASQNIGTSSASQSVTVSNTGSAALNFTALTVAGANSSEFSLAGTCAVGTPVAAGGSCSAVVTFTPQAAGARSATLSISSDASNPSVSVPLSGTGAAAPNAAVSPASLSFGSVLVGARGTAQTTTVSNSGTAPLTLGTISVTDPQFTIGGGTCTSGGTVAAGGSCTVMANFAPTTAGAANATLSIPNNAAASPLNVALSGTGTVPAAPVAQLSPGALSFSQVVGSTTAAQTVTLSNTGTAALALTSISLSGAAASDYAIGSGSSCTSGGSVAAGASCSISLTFTPSATGARSANLSIVHNDTAHSPSTAALNGTGTATPAGLLSVNQLALSYPAQSLGTSSATQTVTVSNTGSAPLTLGSIALGGSHAGDYAIRAASNACVAGTTLAVSASCTVDVVFTPTVASGTRTASLTIAAGTAGTATVSLSGTAAPAAAPLVSLSVTSLDFGSVTVGQTAATRAVMLSNAGSAPLAITSLASTPSSSFPLTHNCPASLAAGASCTLTLGFAPSAAGVITGSVALVSNAAGSPNALALTGTGVALAPAVLSWVGATALSFPDTAVGAQSAPLALSLLNTGGSPAVLQAFTFAGASAAEFLVDPTSSCVAGSSLAAGSNCMLRIVFAPASVGARSATLAIVSPATPPAAAQLSGNGISSGVPVLSLSPSAITLLGNPNQPLQSQVLVVSNNGAAPLIVSAISPGAGLSVLDSRSTGGGNCTPVPFTLAPGASCTLIVNPLTSSVASAVQITSNASPQPASVPVSGTATTNAGTAGSAGGLLALLAATWRRRRARVAPGR